MVICWLKFPTFLSDNFEKELHDATLVDKDINASDPIMEVTFILKLLSPIVKLLWSFFADDIS